MINDHLLAISASRLIGIQLGNRRPLAGCLLPKTFLLLLRVVVKPGIFVITLTLTWGCFSYASGTPQPPLIRANSYALIDADSGQILAEQDAHATFEPASTTKLMTAYLVFSALEEDRLSLNQKLAVTTSAWKMQGTSMFLDPRMRVPVDDLIKGMLVQSGNDATHLLAETLGGTAEAFATMMNDRAQKLGMRNTRFMNPEGMPSPGHLSTAHDLAVLGMSVLRDFPQYAHYFSIKNYYYPGTPPSNGRNRNTLLFTDPSIEGLKTGHTEAAGYCLVAAASRDAEPYGKRRLIAVVLGAASEQEREIAVEKLLNWGFRFHENLRMDIAGSPHETQRIWQGQKKHVRLRTPPTSISIPVGEAKRIETEFDIPTPLLAPVNAGQQVGVLRVTYDGQPHREIPIIADETIEEGSFLVKTLDSLVIWFNRQLSRLGELFLL